MALQRLRRLKPQLNRTRSSFVRQQQASVADCDWLFGGAGDGPGDRAEGPAEPAEKRPAKSSRAQKATRDAGTGASSTTEQREFIRAKKFSGEDQ